jgi:hypothetical protein
MLTCPRLLFDAVRPVPFCFDSFSDRGRHPNSDHGRGPHDRDDGDGGDDDDANRGAGRHSRRELSL